LPKPIFLPKGLSKEIIDKYDAFLIDAWFLNLINLNFILNNNEFLKNLILVDLVINYIVYIHNRGVLWNGFEYF